MISVCIATYNGSKFIVPQLESILVQLDSNDEVIITDDSSNDNTVSLIQEIGDSRVKLYNNAENMGVIKTFSRSISLAKGDLIFLSDQDDIWCPTKVKVMREYFINNLDTTLCLSDSKMIYKNGIVGNRTYFQLRHGFKVGVLANIIKNKYLGCSIAFKRSMLGYIMPFPKNIPSHDMWIGIINAAYGKVGFIEEPLFYYRRHNENVTTISHGNLFTMVRWRLIFLFRFFQRVLTIGLSSKNAPSGKN